MSLLIFFEIFHSQMPVCVKNIDDTQQLRKKNQRKNAINLRYDCANINHWK